MLGGQAADRARGEDLPDAQRPQRPQVGPVRYLVGGITVVDAVPGQESHLVLPDRADGDGTAGLTEWRVQADAAGGRVEKAVEAAAANHSKHLCIVADPHETIGGGP